jgi:hypothetical protein
MLLAPAAKEELARRANALAKLSRSGGAPVLTGKSSVDVVGQWLQWSDPNGSHTKELCEAEGIEPYDEETSWEALIEMVAANE